jgi:hypothetical protein
MSRVISTIQLIPPLHQDKTLVKEPVNLRPDLAARFVVASIGQQVAA